MPASPRRRSRATAPRRKPKATKPVFGLVWHRDARLQTIDHRIVAACKVANLDIVADDNGRPSAQFILVGEVTRDVDRIVSRLEGIRAGKAGGQ